jgi:hypothetical protein
MPSELRGVTSTNLVSSSGDPKKAMTVNLISQNGFGKVYNIKTRKYKFHSIIYCCSFHTWIVLEFDHPDAFLHFDGTIPIVSYSKKPLQQSGWLPGNFNSSKIQKCIFSP